ncbi:bifunctional proline dehydrogenase/L-glutamate gamma-semialdehyde dehydrogenase PutA [Kordiimonas aquimaris]|uniref:bifunctional proline dehydrogenase/L-glutamate gamma-semialdehyde dehydrogenase PutA n=1 Tax=Kordiimonas aquimaris TaxID=707591 RepID=UPI0021D264F5|nr:bifunctional proline dehydrogenase/L-glutamate gamma-semialdehyde dehydrogenase PutA [Kordiimonas aquimaris]
MNAAVSRSIKLPQFKADYVPNEEACVQALLEHISFGDSSQRRIKSTATDLITALRSEKSWVGDVDDFLHTYGLSTDEGLALMVLAEALLRVPDSETADTLIEDKLGAESWHFSDQGKPFVTASTWALALGARLTKPQEGPQAMVTQAVKRLGKPTVRTATRQAMKILGRHFVLGQTIDSALKRAAKREKAGYRYSFDMLGEGARTAADAARYYEAYANAIEKIGKKQKKAGKLPSRAGISVKLSAIHPRYHETHKQQVLADLVPQVIALAEAAKSYDLNFTIDAEEAERLSLSLDVFAAVASSETLAGWSGFGLAVQAYQKRAGAVIDWLVKLANILDRQFMVRLVKGAYWDTEVKLAQEEGLQDYPVYTRKASTDLSYTVCAQKIAAAGDRIYGQFATHNALTTATVIEIFRDRTGTFEFQCLHGMGEALYENLTEKQRVAACRIYAPVGSHEDLLAYLVRRILENGANSSFVNTIEDETVPIEQLTAQPWEILPGYAEYRNQSIALPADILGETRKNASGLSFGDREHTKSFMQRMCDVGDQYDSVTSLINGAAVKEGAAQNCVSPYNIDHTYAQVFDADASIAEQALAAAAKGFLGWRDTPVNVRAAALDKMANMLEQQQAELIAVIAAEAGRTIADGIAEVREAVDFCRYYAGEARKLMGEPTRLPGPTGEVNMHQFIGRGVFVCIAPWNFPLAIFVGQIAAALAAGNAVVAKPAAQTPVIAHKAVKMLHAAGVPVTALHLVLGGPDVGAALTSSTQTSGVAFTGSTKTAWAINRSLAARDTAIAPLIAETGGINAMIVDATALPEQVADDVIASAFQSAGQRCSALRLLCIQDDVADKMIEMIKGAAKELVLGAPQRLSTDVGPVIDAAALNNLETYLTNLPEDADIIFGADDLTHGVPDNGHFIAPHIVALPSASALTREVFGPVLHVVRYKAGTRDEVVNQINASGFGLTFGIHSRLKRQTEKVADTVQAGNIYINRNTIGAVVGVQPFGGMGLSGTGPKAGGPAYLYRFLSEKVITTDTTAVGGNASLIAMSDGV